MLRGNLDSIDYADDGFTVSQKSPGCLDKQMDSIGENQCLEDTGPPKRSCRTRARIYAFNLQFSMTVCSIVSLPCPELLLLFEIYATTIGRWLRQCPKTSK